MNTCDTGLQFSVVYSVAMNQRVAAEIVALCVSIKMRCRRKKSIWVKRRLQPINKYYPNWNIKIQYITTTFFGRNMKTFNIYLTLFHL